MSYRTQTALAADEELRQRVVACAAMEEIPEPEQWAYAVRWKLSAQPGWADVTSIDEETITDEMILAAVRLLKPLPVAEPDPAT